MLTKPSRPVKTFADTWLRASAGQRFLLDVQTAQHLEQERLKPWPAKSRGAGVGSRVARAVSSLRASPRAGCASVHHVAAVTREWRGKSMSRHRGAPT